MELQPLQSLIFEHEYSQPQICANMVSNKYVLKSMSQWRCNPKNYGFRDDYTKTSKWIHVIATFTTLLGTVSPVI